jgi:hypothetical protein
MRHLRPRTVTAALAGCAVLVAGATIAGAGIASASGLADGGAATAPTSSTAIAPDPSQVPLAPIVDRWPDQYAVTGGKSEPLYTERITLSRDGDLFALRIEAIAQGDEPLGTQRGEVRVLDDGAVTWVAGCTKSAADCADDPALRGFLTTAALVGLERSGRLPETATARTLHDTPVVCVADDAVHPNAAPSIAGLDPCFSLATGALLGHWSTASTAFVGPTLAAGFTEASVADDALFAEVTP